MCALIKAAPPKAGKTTKQQKLRDSIELKNRKQNMNKAFGLNEQKN